MVRAEYKRVYLRESTFDDCKLFAKWEKNEFVSGFFTINEGRDYEEVVCEYVNRKNDPSVLQLTICLKDDDEPIGRIHISNINWKYDSLDITRIYLGEKSVRGEGLGEEALRACLYIAFEDYKMERVTLDYFDGNDIAASLYTKVGFQKEGVMRNGGKKNGKYVNLILMSMLSSEYKK